MKIGVKVSKGDIFYADLSAVMGSEQGGIRPVLIVSNERNNQSSPVVIAVPLTSVSKRPDLSCHYLISKKVSNLKLDSLALCEQIRTIDKMRLKSKVGHISGEDLAAVEKAIKYALGMD